LAVQAYIDPLQRALACISHNVLVNGGGYYAVDEPQKPHVLTIGGDGRAQLHGTDQLYLSVIQQYFVIQLEPGEWKVRTAYYSYGLETEIGTEILVYHWHPKGVSPISYPHLHIEAGAGVGRREIQGSHIPTGRIALEDFILYLIETFGAKTLRDDWRAILDETGTAFQTHKTW
jgi:hypothetical protein